MGIKSLLDLMMEDVKTADQAYNILPVNLKEYNDDNIFEGLAELFDENKQIAAGCSKKQKVKKKAAVFYEALREKKKKLPLRCSDGKSIDAKPFEPESEKVQLAYAFGCKTLELEFNSNIIKKVGNFCGTRAEIQDDPANDEILVQNKLKAFNKKFRKRNKRRAIDLITVAFHMEIKSLVDLMMEDVVRMFTDMTADEAYKILPVHLKEYHDIKFEVMVELLDDMEWAFKDENMPGEQIAAASQRENMPDKRIEAAAAEAKERIELAKSKNISSYDPVLKEYLERARKQYKWDPELMKVSFNDFTYLSSLEKRHWLTAHFLLRGCGDVCEHIYMDSDTDDEYYRRLQMESDSDDDGYYE